MGMDKENFRAAWIGRGGFFTQHSTIPPFLSCFNAAIAAEFAPGKPQFSNIPIFSQRGRHE